MLGDAVRAGVTTARCWKRSRGAFAPDRRGVMWPAEFGPWQTLWKRHRRWSTDRTYQRIFEHVLTEHAATGKLDWLLSGDSTIVRAHQHAAGAPSADHTGGRVE